MGGPGETYDYVINRMIVDEGAEPGEASRAFYGFNLDGRFSPVPTVSQQLADCSHGDYFSTIDPDQNASISTCLAGQPGGGTRCQGGVDNQLPNAVQTIAQITADPTGSPLLNRQINEGRYALLIRVAGVNGAPGDSLNDPAVTVRVYPVAWPTFRGCDGVQQQRQTYAVDDRSLRQAGNLDAPLVEFRGCIIRGRLRQPPMNATAAATPMVLPLVAAVRVPLYDLRLRFDLGVDEGQSGNLGGTVKPSEVISALDAVVTEMESNRYVGPLIQAFVDIAGRGRSGGVSCESSAGLIGVGVGFTALRARIQPTTVSGPIPGACGDSTGALDAGVADVGGDQ